MAARGRLGNARHVDGESGWHDGLWESNDELNRRAPVTGQPIQHPHIGIVVVGLPRGPLGWKGVPVSMHKPLSVLVVRVAAVRVLKGGLRE